MWINMQIATSLLITWFATVYSAEYMTGVELRRELFANYDRKVRPVINQSEAVLMNVTFHISSIDSLDLKRQTLKWSGYLQLKWYDEMLVWNSSNQGDADYITLFQSDIWLPDFVIANSVSSRRSLGSPDTLVVVSRTGLVTWEPGIVTETSCKVDIRKYPFDVQKCTFEFHPWMTTRRDLDTVSVLEGIAMSSFVPHGEFEVLGTKHERFVIQTDFANEGIQGIRYTVSLERRTTFYWLIMIFPLLTFPLLCPISFLVPVESGEKITLSITVVLSFMVFIGSTSEAMPKLSETTSLLLVYSSVQTTIAILTVVANGIIIAVHKLPTDYKFCSGSFGPRIYLQKGLKHENVPNYYESDPQRATKESTEKWIQISRKIDKICFWVFATLTLVTPVLFAMLI